MLSRNYFLWKRFYTIFFSAIAIIIGFIKNEINGIIDANQLEITIKFEKATFYGKIK